MGAAAEVVTDSRKECGVGVEGGYCGEERGPERGQRVEAESWEIEQGHQCPGAGGKNLRGGIASEEKCNGSDVDQKHGGDDGEEEHRGVMELGEGGAGDHVADFGKGIVGAEAEAAAGEAHPDFAAGALDGAGEGAIVDDLAADGGQAADAVKGCAAEEDAAASRSGSFCLWIGNPFRGIEFEEEEEEGGDQGALGESFGLQEDHQGSHVEVAARGSGNEAKESVWGVGDVGVGEPEKIGAC